MEEDLMEEELSCGIYIRITPSEYDYLNQQSILLGKPLEEIVRYCIFIYWNKIRKNDAYIESIYKKE